MLVRKIAVAVAGLMGTSLAMACTNAPGFICINEMLVQTGGNPTTQKSHEYVELRGEPNAVIPAGTYLVAIDGDRNQNPGTIDVVINLGGKSFGSNGFLVLLAQGNGYAFAEPDLVNDAAALEVGSGTGLGGIGGWSGNGGANAFERSTATYLVVTAAIAPVPGQDIDTVGASNGDGQPDNLFPSWTILDSIAMSDNTNDRTYGALNFRTGGVSFTGATVPISARTAYLGRFGDSFGSDAAAWVASGAPGGANPNWLLSATVVVPTGVAGKPLNHIGGTNIWPNAAPLHALPTAPSVNEDTALVFSAGNGNAISVSDSDAGTGNMTQQLSVTVGTLTLASTAGITVDAGADGSGAMTISGSLSALNAALNGLSFSAPQDFNGTATLNIDTNDNGSTGTDGAKSDTDALVITVVAVNDVPSFTVGANQSVASDAGLQTVAGFATNLSAGPTDENGQLLDFIVSNDNNLLFTVAPAIAANGTLTYTPNASFNGTATVTVQIHDDGGVANGGVDTSATQTFTITTTTPLLPATVTTIDDNDADDLLPLNGTVLFDVSFSRNVDGSTAATTDFSFTNTSTGTATIDSVSTIDSDTVQVSATATGAGTLVLQFTGEILDTFATAVATPAEDDTTLTVDGVFPTLVSVARANGNPTNAASVDFTVTFSESVTGIDAADFNLASAGVTGASITSVTGSGTTWTVSVGTGTGDGTIALGLAAAPVAQDIAGNALQTSLIATDYTIDHTAPLPVSITKLDSDNPTIPYVRFEVTFNEIVSGVDIADFALVTSGGIVGATIIDVSGVGTTWVVDVYTGLASGTIGLELLDDDSVIDAAGNPLGAGLVGATTYAIDAAALAPLFKDGFETQPVL